MILVRFLHLIGLALWLGGGLWGLVLLVGARGEDPTPRGDHLALTTRLYAWIVAPGAMLATASGLALTMMAASAGYGARLGTASLAAMQAIGLVAGVLELFVGLPTAQRLGRVLAASDPAEIPKAGERFRSRLAGVLATTLTLVVVSFYLGVAGTPH